MKIHFIISSLNGGGAQRVLTVMANNLAEKLNYKITIITLFNVKSEYYISPKIEVKSLSGMSFLPSHTLRSILRLSKFYLNKRNRPDVIISFITLTNQITIIVAKIFGIKIIAQEHNSYHRYMKNRKLSTDFTKKRLYPMADIVTVLTSYDIDFYKKYGVNVRVLPNPCSFPPITENNYNRQKVIVAVGNLDRYHHKGFDNLIHLITPVLKKNPDWVLKIAGSGDNGLKYLSELVQKNDMTDRIVFTGFIKNVSDLLFDSSIFVLSSRFEGLPMVLLEGMSQGIACIAYDCVTGPSDIITNYENGILVEDQNHELMQTEMNNLIQNESLRVKLGKEGINSLKKYDIDSITERYKSLIEEVARAK